MTFAIFLVVLSALGLATILLLGKGLWFGPRDESRNPPKLQPIDVEAFRNLIDEQEEAFLRGNLSPPEFRRVHRERMLAAAEYVRAAYRNAGALVRIGEATRESADPQIAQAAARLFDNAVALRWSSAQVIPRLYLSVVFPGGRGAARNLLERYDSIARQALVLSGMASGGRKT
jgi:hypothetical protein